MYIKWSWTRIIIKLSRPFGRPNYKIIEILTKKSDLASPVHPAFYLHLYFFI